MITKRELVNQIQELANYHLGHKGLNFNNYMNLNKAELERRLVNAQKMHELDTQVRAIYANWTSEQLLVAGCFPLSVQPELKEAHDQLNILGRQASELWFSV